MIGRKEELKALNALLDKKTASLVCIRGRRRIGKSTLVKEFAKNHPLFIEIQGIAPQADLNNQDQIDHFLKTISKKFHCDVPSFSSWSDCFGFLASLLKKSKAIVFLDEISWMGKYDPNFSGYLKVAWDTQLKLNPNLVLVLCGSVSTWIKKNILDNTGFVGRFSLNIKLEGLSIVESCKLARLDPKKHSSLEILKILSMTGGVPKYLEEIDSSQSAEANISRLLLDKSGSLFNEFEQIFHEIFESKSEGYLKILLAISEGKRSQKEISTSLKTPNNRDLSERLDNLLESGFLSRDFSWDIEKTTQSSLSKYRISDNFLHFYLKFIFKKKTRILKLKSGVSESLNWSSILGYQFQNLVCNNYEILLPLINIRPDEVVDLGPFFQTKTARKKGCQLDLLIQTRSKNLYCIEIKSSNHLGKEIVTEMKKRIEALKVPRNFTKRPVLVYSGMLLDSVLESEYYDKIVSFEDFLK